MSIFLNLITEQGKWGLKVGADDDASNEEELKARGYALASQVETSYKVMQKDFRSDMIRLVGLLQSVRDTSTQKSNNGQRSKKKNGVSERNLRFLSVRMDFNHFYEKLEKELREVNHRSGGEERGQVKVPGTGGRLTASQLGMETKR